MIRCVVGDTRTATPLTGLSAVLLLCLFLCFASAHQTFPKPHLPHAMGNSQQGAAAAAPESTSVRTLAGFLFPAWTLHQAAARPYPAAEAGAAAVLVQLGPLPPHPPGQRTHRAGQQSLLGFSLFTSCPHAVSYPSPKSSLLLLAWPTSRHLPAPAESGGASPSSSIYSDTVRSASSSPKRSGRGAHSGTRLPAAPCVPVPGAPAGGRARGGGRGTRRLGGVGRPVLPSLMGLHRGSCRPASPACEPA